MKKKTKKVKKEDVDMGIVDKFLPQSKPKIPEVPKSETRVSLSEPGNQADNVSEPPKIPVYAYYNEAEHAILELLNELTQNQRVLTEQIIKLVNLIEKQA